MQTNSLLSEIDSYTEELFRINNKPYLLYHNIDHTRLVVQHSAEIAIYYKLDDNLRVTLLAAAWFHDTGYLLGDPEGHEERGVQLMKEFLIPKGIDEKIINDISLCIMATKLPPAPSSLLEKILCDADTYHLGTKDFFHLDKQVWKEVELRLNKPVDNTLSKSLLFLEKHQFFTSYCQQFLSAGKNRNILQLKMFLQNGPEKIQ
jgi:HD superfamily phosphodiesterase